MVQHAKPQLYVKLKKQLSASPGQILKLKDVAEVVAPENLSHILDITIYRVPNNEHYIVLSPIDIVKHIHAADQNICIHLVGTTDLIISTSQDRRTTSSVWLVIVWLLLFVGSGLAIMNFHADVSMPEVHQRIYYLITGKQTDRPLWLQIPYAFGIGIGMILFFNHLFKRRFNEEPSPLEVEMFLYQESIDQYVIDRDRYRNDVND